MLDANFWQDRANSKVVIKEKKLFEELINSHKQTVEKLNDLKDLYELSIEESNINIQNEVIQDLKELFTKAKKMKLNVFYPMKQTH